MRNLLVITFLFLLLSACGDKYVYEEIQVLSEGGWVYADTLDYRVSIQDTLILYNLYLEVEHTTSYPYQNLYTQVYTRFPSGERKKKVVSLELADKTGEWQGDCRGETCRFLAPIQLNAFFSDPGDYVLTLEQYLRESPVEGIRSIALKLEDTGARR